MRLPRVPLSPNPDALDLIEFRCFIELRVIQLPSQLQVHPHVGAGAEVLGQAQCGVRCNATTAVHEFVHPLIRHADAVCEISLRESHRIEEFLEQHFAGVRRCPVRRDADHGQRSGSGVVVDYFNTIGTSGGPCETDAILIVDANAVLSGAAVVGVPSRDWSGRTA